MTDTISLEGLVALSQALGGDPAFVQGGGGNSSVKVAAGQMHVKASGTCLRDMTPTHGHVTVDPRAVVAILAQAPRDDADFARRLLPATEPSAFRPSMETGFHAVLGPVVAHTHAVYLNVLTCAHEGPALAAEIVPEARWIAYHTPGLALSQAIGQAPGAAVYLLQNHGVIVTGDAPGAVAALHDEINARVRRRLDLPEGLDPDAPRGWSLEEVRANVLFPDQVVFTSAGPELLGTRAARETLAAYDYIRRGIAAAGLTPNFLPAGAAAQLLSMDAEKNRQALAT